MTSDRAQIFIQYLSNQCLESIGNIHGRYGISPKGILKIWNAFILDAQQVAIPSDVVCLSGCTYCCHTRVTASIPEVLVIGQEIRDRLPAESLSMISDHLAAIVKAGQPDNVNWWHQTNTPCPFLDITHGLCLIYDIRPFACRSYHSLSVDDCRNGFNTDHETEVLCYPVLRRRFDLYSSSITTGFYNAGLASYPVGFISALNLVLDDNDIYTRWLSGDDVFSGCRILPTPLSLPG